MRQTRDFFGSLGYTVWGLVLLAVVVGGVLAINFVALPWWTSIQRDVVEESKSYNDSRNTMLFTYMTEYTDLDVKLAEAGENEAAKTAYRGQQKAILDSMCQLIGTMNAGEVAPAVSAFIGSHGGCR